MIAASFCSASASLAGSEGGLKLNTSGCTSIVLIADAVDRAGLIPSTANLMMVARSTKASDPIVVVFALIRHHEVVGSIPVFTSTEKWEISEIFPFGSDNLSDSSDIS